MPHAAAARMATRDRDAACYQRHRPEQTLLYRIVEAYYPAFTAHLAEPGSELPGYVQREFEDYLKCGRLDHAYFLVPAQAYVPDFIATFKEFPPRQKAASFSLDQVMEKLLSAGGSK